MQPVAVHAHGAEVGPKGITSLGRLQADRSQPCQASATASLHGQMAGQLWCEGRCERNDSRALQVPANSNQQQLLGATPKQEGTWPLTHKPHQ